MIINKKDFAEWLHNPVTEAYFEAVQYKLKLIEKGLAEGLTLNSESVDNTALQTARMVGEAIGLQSALQVELEAIEEE